VVNENGQPGAKLHGVAVRDLRGRSGRSARERREVLGTVGPTKVAPAKVVLVSAAPVKVGPASGLIAGNQLVTRIFGRVRVRKGVAEQEIERAATGKVQAVRFVRAAARGVNNNRVREISAPAGAPCMSSSVCGPRRLNRSTSPKVLTLNQR
jgi:hypothetical protein